jgi:hypothetical protein
MVSGPDGEPQRGQEIGKGVFEEMIWQLTDEYRVKTEPMNYVLQELRTVRPKDKPPYEEWQTLGYYSGLRSVMKALPDYMGLRDDVTSLESLLGRLENTIEEVIARVNK